MKTHEGSPAPKDKNNKRKEAGDDRNDNKRARGIGGATLVDKGVLQSVLSTFVESLLMMPKRREAAKGGPMLSCTVWSHWLRYPYSPMTTVSPGPLFSSSSPSALSHHRAPLGPGFRTPGGDNDIENLSRFMQDLIAMPLNLVVDFYHGGQTVKVNPFGSNVHTWLGLDALTAKEVTLLAIIVRHHDVLLGSVNSDRDRRWLRMQRPQGMGHGDGEGHALLIDRELLLMSFCYGFLVESIAYGRYMDANQTLVLALRGLKDRQQEQQRQSSPRRPVAGEDGRTGVDDAARELEEHRRIVSSVERHVSRRLVIGDVAQYAQEFLVNSLLGGA